ncbi:adenylate/guanylate cyclase domain-containing protein [Tengunoibacter tsumagoiensis]|uniref:Guanylate cyclase domain-containing protein n=1 Tax=Tengunoibacter tsumagoiensis TaxID=2014871 RepID=A0A401ZZ88_9CHLR|nr:adenylate/guanylate cyclase domain-containing protein [Tengunoibacter tsumagoiensis]GCE12165.1 hypothetical protein KTT_20240 [Tengunoibacter tsumagoiensis]
MVANDWVKLGDDLRVLNETVGRVLHKLNEQAQKLEVAVEGRYVNESGDPRIKLLAESLHFSRVVEVELRRANQNLQRLRTLLPTDSTPGSSPQHLLTHSNDQFVTASLPENERMALTITGLTQERNELETLYGIARTLNSTLEFDEVLRLVMEQVISFVKAERGFLMLVNPQTGLPELTFARDANEKSASEGEFARARISKNIVTRVIQTRSPLLTDDAQADDALKEIQSIIAYGIHSIMCAPLIVRGACIGAVYVDSRFNTRLFQPKHLELLLAFCNQAAIAIDNARLFAELNKAIKKVSEDKQYMDNIFGSIANGVVTTDSKGLITTFNAAASIILRLDPIKVQGIHYTEAFKEIADGGLSDLLSRAHLQHEHGTIVTQSIDCQIVGRDGLINLSCYVSSLRDLQGEHIGIALVIDDHTELKRSEARAKEIRRIFERYVHPNVVQQLIQNPLALNLGGETKEISVVFADIRGYTRLSEMLPPEEVMHLVNRYLKLMCEAIWEEEGTLTAFQGDALMAIFNAPLQQRLHALHAVRAAWKMRLAVQNYQQSLPEESRVSFGIGVNTGLATVGNVGAQERLQNYTALGDVVNIASRLQSHATENNILINESTYMQVYRYIQTGKAFPLAVKNKTTSLTVRYLLGVNPGRPV